MKKAHNNKGGSIASNGYKLIFVGKSHHLSDVRGYAYEHRINAEIKIGRRLRKGEQVHHIDEDKLNNRPENLQVVKNFRHHLFLHRKKESNLRLPDEKNVLVSCSCGCGNQFMRYDSSGRMRKYVSGHNPMNNYAERYVLESLKNGSLTLDDLIANYSNGKGIKSVLSRMYKNGTLIKPKRGIYQLKLN